MLRRLYSWIIRLHPRRFRDRFGPEMLAIFDESGADRFACRLLLDGARSLVRQWAFRSGSIGAEVAETVPWSGGGARAFYVFGDYRPRTTYLIGGGMLTLFVFCAAYFACEYTWTHPVLMPLVTVQFQTTAASVKEAISILPGPKPMPNPSEPIPAPLSTHSVPQPDIPAPVKGKQAPAGLLASEANHATTTAPADSVRSSGNAAAIPANPETTILSYPGIYKTDPPDALVIDVTAEDGRLDIQIAGGPKATLAPLGGTNFMFSDPGSDLIEFMKRQRGPEYELVIYRSGRRLTAQRARTR